MTSGSLEGRLWSDEPSKIDFLAARAIAETVADAVLDDSLDPLAIGLSGPWGSGKTTVLELVASELNTRSDPEHAVLVVRTDPWRYDPSVGAKESLIGDVLDALVAEITKPDSKVGKAGKAWRLAKKLAGRVDWAKATKLAAKGVLAAQIPKVDELVELIREPAAADADDLGEPRGLAGFQTEFDELLSCEELAYIKRVAVLVDDLDRCLVDTVVETLEAIRLFLSAPGMSFVIAADEERVAEAIRTRLPDWVMPEERPGTVDALPPEPPSKLYLHKIVQTTVPLPALGEFDTEAYLLMLQLQNRTADALDDGQLEAFIDECARLRAVGALDDIKAPEGIDVQAELGFARRLTSILYEKLAGNPRRIKRFLNDLNIRRSIAARRGIELDVEVVAKLMVLEVLLPDQFQVLLSWLRAGELHDRLHALEAQGQSATNDAPPGAGGAAVAGAEAEAEGTEPTAAGEAEDAIPPGPEKETGAVVNVIFDDDLVRWAKLRPDLADLDLSPYLHLAASFSGDLLVSQELPGRLRDLAAQLTATHQLDRQLLTTEQLQALPAEDIETLVHHLGLRARDRRQEQRGAVAGIGRLAMARPEVAQAALAAFRRIPPTDLSVGTAMHLRSLDLPGIEQMTSELAERVEEKAVRNALTADPLNKRNS